MLKHDSVPDDVFKLCLFIGTRDPDTHCSLANNLSAATLKCFNTQPSVITVGHAGAAAAVRLPSGGREVEHTG